MNSTKRQFVFVLLALLIALTGCGRSQESDKGATESTSVESTSTEATTAEVEADTPETVTVDADNAADSTEAIPAEEVAATEAEPVEESIAEEVSEEEEAAEDAADEIVADGETAVENNAIENNAVENDSEENDSAEGSHATGAPNRLIDEKSPYLLQHAYNPVDWFPWGEEAFAKAAAENKPIFLSIGYSTCHWCHVMKRESFENEEVAALMNEAFVSIKLDREERPDIDDIYMTVAQMMDTRGGWPLNVLLMPDQKPFFVATYIPRETRFQRIGMLELIPQIEEAWQTRYDEILAFANQITTALQPVQMSTATSIGQVEIGEDLLGPDTLSTAFDQLNQRFDPVNGGFGTSPKFPSPHNMLFLLRYWQRTGDEQALNMVETTLRNMRLGGVYDQIGYGFHRYSTDERWKLPHFEKMLYDQAMLSMAYTETYLATKDEEYEEVAREIFTYVLRDMTHEEGGFFSAENADSAEVEGGEEEEGVFYFWTIEELVELLGEEDANLIVTISAMTEEGNFLDEATRQPLGTNIIYWNLPPAESAAAVNLTLEELEAWLEPVRQTIFEAREERVHPSKDDKILTDWNGLMMVAFAKAGRAFDEPLYIDAAAKSADFILETMRREDGRLLHRYRDGEVKILANVDDYAFLIWGLLELYESTFELRYLEEAITLNAELETHFWDEFSGGFFFTADDAEELISRQKAIYDGAIPSGNSASMLNLLRLGRITADTAYEERAAALAQSFSTEIGNNPTAYTQLMSALEFGVGPSYEVVIVGEQGADDTNALTDALNDEYVPSKVVLLRDPDDNAPIIDLADYTKYYYTLEDKATAYVCQNYICEFPTTDPEAMVALLFKDEEINE